MASEQTHHFNSEGFQLTGTLHLPDAPNPPVVIGCHGLFADRNSMKQISLANACIHNGLAYFRFDHRGCGDSEGRFAEVTSLAARVRDLYHAVETMQQHTQTGALAALFGSSFGGTVVLDYAASHNTPKLVTYAAPINSSTINHGSIRYNNGKSPPSSLLTDALEFDIASRIASINDIMVCHSQGDETVPASHAKEIYRLCNDPKELLVFEGGDHRMSDKDHQARFEARFLRWIIGPSEV